MSANRRVAAAALAVWSSILWMAAALAQGPEIHSRHVLHGLPAGTPATNDIVFADVYVLSSNDGTKLADWVCYQLTSHEVMGELDLERKWRTDPFLDAGETLEPNVAGEDDDYAGAFGVHGYTRGHLAPLASFRGTRYASQVNRYSNIAPQRSSMNSGPWKRLEDSVRSLVRTGKTVWVMTGPLYERDMPALPGADEPHAVPSGFWKIVASTDAAGALRVAAFVVDQEDGAGVALEDRQVSVQEVQSRSGLDFFWMLEDGAEAVFESGTDAPWAQSWID